MAAGMTKKDRQLVLVKMTLIWLAFLVIAFVLTFPFPVEERFLPFSVTLLVGLFVAGVFASKRFARSYDEFVWGITAFIIVVTLFVLMTYYRYMIGEAMPNPYNVALYAFSVWLPLSVGFGFLLQEILLGFKIKKPFSFRLKRFGGRMMLVGFFVFLNVITSSFMNLVAPLISEEYTVTLFIFGYLLVSIILVLITRNPKVGHFFNILLKGQW